MMVKIFTDMNNTDILPFPVLSVMQQLKCK